MEPYKDPWLSLVRYVKGIAAEALAKNLVPALPSFVNLDAHAQINNLPTEDFLALCGFSMHFDEHLMTVFAQVGVSTYNDVDNLRHIDLMNLVVKRFIANTVIPIYSGGNITTPVTNMVCTSTPMVDPTNRDEIRSLQMLTIRLLPLASVNAGQN